MTHQQARQHPLNVFHSFHCSYGCFLATRLVLRRCYPILVLHINFDWQRGLYDKISITIDTKMIQGNITRMLPVAVLLVLHTRNNIWQHTRDISVSLRTRVIRTSSIDRFVRFCYSGRGLRSRRSLLSYGHVGVGFL